MEKIKKVAAINDLSGYGKCSLAVALPILSALGVQCCPLPTAILSNHTGYESFFFDDYTDRMENYYHEWEKLKLTFDCIYTGFLGSEKQIDIVQNFISKFKKDNILLVDPVMGDNGTIYATYTDEMCNKMKKLASIADIVTPNLTEACILSDTKFKDLLKMDEIKEMARKIHELGAKKVVITGIKNDDMVGNYIYDGNGQIFYTKNVPYQYSGTGDLFASLLCGYILNGYDLNEAVQKSAHFVYKATLYSSQTGIDRRNGVAFEKILKDVFLNNENEC